MRLRLRVKEVARERGMSMTKLHIKSEVAYSTVRRLFRGPFAEVTTARAESLQIPCMMHMECFGGSGET